MKLQKPVAALSVAATVGHAQGLRNVVYLDEYGLYLSRGRVRSDPEKQLTSLQELSSIRNKPEPGHGQARAHARYPVLRPPQDFPERDLGHAAPLRDARRPSSSICKGRTFRLGHRRLGVAGRVC